jgi:hypothetical protein
VLCGPILAKYQIATPHSTQNYCSHCRCQSAEQESVKPEAPGEEHYQVVFGRVKQPQLIGEADEVKL